MGVEADAEEGVDGLGTGGYLGEEGGVILIIICRHGSSFDVFDDVCE